MQRKHTTSKESVLGICMALVLSFIVAAPLSAQVTYAIVDTDVHDYSDSISTISAPTIGQAFYGQDAHYQGSQPSYTDNGDGTVTDNVTGLMWQQDMGPKISYADALVKADTMTLGGYSDWRFPTLKELFSLALYSGRCMGDQSVDLFIDDTYFVQPIGNTAAGEREIDAQTWSITQYSSTTMNNDSTVFGMNFIDGRVKGYPKYSPGSGNTTPNTMYARMVRGNINYGTNNFVDNNDGTITDLATGLMWQQADDGISRNWEDALAYAENLSLAGHTDWRLPNIKELHSLVDYSRSPDATGSPAMDALFSLSSITFPNGQSDYPFIWSGTTLQDGPDPYSAGAYVSFGESLGMTNGNFFDAHGAGAVRSDPKSGDPSGFPSYFGPQGDIQYVYNHVLSVRDVSGTVSEEEKTYLDELQIFPNPADDQVRVSIPEGSDRLMSIVIVDLSGRELQRMGADEHKNEFIQVDLSEMKSGMYIMSFEFEDSRHSIPFQRK